MIDKVAGVAARYEELNRLMADPEVSIDPVRIREYAQEQSDLSALHQGYQRYQQVAAELRGTRQMLAEELDPEMRELAEAERASLEAEIEELTEQLRLLLLPKDPNDDEEHHRRDSRRGGRRRGGALRGRPVPHVHSLRRGAGLEGGTAHLERVGHWRLQGGHL